jgi:hypothetical protein
MYGINYKLINVHDSMQQCFCVVVKVLILKKVVTIFYFFKKKLNHKITKTHHQKKITKNNKLYHLSPRAISLTLEEDGRARHTWAMPTHNTQK